MLSFLPAGLYHLYRSDRGEMNVQGKQTEAILLSYISHCIRLFALAQPESIRLLSNS